MFHIVDDDLTIGEILSELISEFGYDTFLFHCPVEYLKHIESPEYERPIAIISDVKMPGMNGYDFMNQVKQINPQQKFVMITGTPEFQHVHKHQACMYLCKPFEVDSLKTITHVLMRCHNKCCLQDNEHADDRALFHINCWTCPHGGSTADKGKINQ